jgi:2-haloacid dehalogenase
MKPVIVLDMNETMLDLSALDPTFAAIFGRAEGAEIRKQWFKQVLELFLTVTITGEYRSFDNLSDDALRMLAAQRGRKASADDRAVLREAQKKITAYPDVRPGLTRLKEAGFTLATLSNSTKASTEALLTHAGIRDQFDEVLSADAVKRFKPAREAYEYAATTLKVKPGEVLLVAAHGWDIAGAIAAGCRAAFVARPEKVLSPEGPRPQFEGRDVLAIAEAIVSKHD